MSYRVLCSACGKVMTLEDDAEGEMLVCIACGTRLVAPPAPLVQAREAEDDEDGAAAASDATEVPGLVAATKAPEVAGPRVRRATPRPAGSKESLRKRLIFGAGIVTLAALLVATAVVVWVVTPRRATGLR